MNFAESIIEHYKGIVMMTIIVVSAVFYAITGSGWRVLGCISLACIFLSWEKLVSSLPEKIRAIILICDDGWLYRRVEEEEK